jgi:hypothetical protein
LRRADHPILLDPPVLLAAGWAVVAHALTRRGLRRTGLEAAAPPPPPLPERGVRGVSVALTWRGATCLERSLVLQQWLAAHGSSADVLIGVAPQTTGPGPGPGRSVWDLHAWIEGVDDDDGAHQVLHRLPPRRTAGAGRR